MRGGWGEGGRGGGVKGGGGGLKGGRELKGVVCVTTGYVMTGTVLGNVFNKDQ